MLYWVFKWVLFAPGVRLVFRPWVEGEEHVPVTGAAVLVSNHLSTGDTFLLPAMIRRRMTFPAKAELFSGGSLGNRIVGWFLRNVGQLPMDRSGGRASANSMDGVLRVLRDDGLLGIYPEGTRSPDGRLYKGKTGVARLVLQAGVPVIPVAMVNTQWVPARLTRIPIMRRPGVRIGPPLDFTAYGPAAGDRDVLRYVTDEIMNAVMQLSGQVYVDAYAGSVKDALRAGRPLPGGGVLSRPGAGNPVPPVPAAETAAPEVTSRKTATPSQLTEPAAARAVARDVTP